MVAEPDSGLGLARRSSRLAVSAFAARDPSLARHCAHEPPPPAPLLHVQAVAPAGSLSDVPGEDRGPSDRHAAARSSGETAATGDRDVLRFAGARQGAQPIGELRPTEGDLRACDATPTMRLPPQET